MTLLLVALGVLFLGSVASLLLARRPQSVSLWGAGSALVGSLIGLVPTLHGLLGGGVSSFRIPWQVPGGEFYIRMDALSAFFLVPVFLLSGLASVYGIGYMRRYNDRKSLGLHWACFNLFILGMALVVLARNALLFMMAWEVMSVAAFFLVTFEHDKKDVRAAGWVYLIATHIGAAFLLAMFLLLGRQAGSLDFDLFVGSRTPFLAGAAFILALIGFGTKAGMVPLHVWLPEAHPAAPSHVSALMSGVMIKIGIYGILRTMTFLGAPLGWWGPLLMALGLAGAVLGIALALSQRDIKRVLAYSSIENVGLILLAMGVGIWGLTRGHPAVAVLGLVAGFVHLWNHSLMKGLMFLCAGSVLHGSGTCDMERLGGLMKRMPRTGMAMMAGAVALAALPPLNGFVGEWLVYLGLFRGGVDLGGRAGMAMLVTVGALALVGGLAMICYVRLIGIVWLGEGRSEEARHAHESSAWLTVPLIVLVVLCVLSALFPMALLFVVSVPVAATFGLAIPDVTGPLRDSLPVIGRLNVVLWVGLALCGFLLHWLRKRGGETSASTWGCGYAAPSSRMQYTGKSFSELLVMRIFPRLLRPRRDVVDPEGLFPGDAKQTSRYTDPIDRGLYQAFFKWLPERCAQLRWIQKGNLHYYIAYFLVALILAFVWLSFRRGGGAP